MYRFNNSRGGVTCDYCDILFDENLSFKEYEAIYRASKSKEDKDMCWECKEPPVGRKRCKDSAE